MRATPIARQEWLLSTAVIYHLDPPLKFKWDYYCTTIEPRLGEAEYVIVSVVSYAIDTGTSEAMAWACDSQGEFLHLSHDSKDMRHKVAEVRGTLDHNAPLKQLGYEVEELRMENLPEIPNEGLDDEGKSIEEILQEIMNGLNRNIENLDKLTKQWIKE